jgi:hypothetical protein
MTRLFVITLDMIILQIFLQSSSIRFIVANGVGAVPCDKGINVAPWFGNALGIYVVHDLVLFTDFMLHGKVMLT